MLTTNEKELLRAIITSEYQDSDEVVDNPIWVGSWDTSIPKKSLPGVMASLQKKEYVKTDGEVVAITRSGMTAYEAGN